MSPRSSIIIAALFGSAAALALVFLVRMPLPFPGFSLVAGAVVAMLTAVTVMAWMPAGWIWTETELLVRAFRAYHGVSDDRAEVALDAIAVAHARANVLRQLSAGFVPELRDMTHQAATRLDAGAREIFYDPTKLRALRPIMDNASLIEEAAMAHRALKARSPDDTLVVQSRAKLTEALTALEDAFKASDLRAARGLAQQVEVASDVAETLLAPRRNLSS